MLKTYKFENNELVIDETKLEDAKNICWIDLIEPTKVEDLQVEKLLNLSVPTRDELHEIELSNRLYTENGGIYSVASIVTNIENKNPQIHSVSFIIKDDKLVTLRYVDPYAYRTFLLKTSHYGVTGENTNLCVFLGLIEAIINRIADALEKTGHDLDEVNKKLFSKKLKSKTKLPAKKSKNMNYEKILKEIGYEGDLISKTRESLVSINRLVSFAQQQDIFRQNKILLSRIDIISKDLSSLSDHASFLSNKVTFLLDATLGLIGIEQNAIIKIFSVAAVAFLPPTLIASIYGMNFNSMPELHFKYGYALALLFIFLSALIPLKYFKRKGWI